MLSDFYKESKNSRIWRIDDLDETGSFLFSFDKKNILNFWTDYDKLSLDRKAVFDKGFPAMAELKNQPVKNGFDCHVCGKHTFANNNTDEKCPVCYWWNDILQNTYPDYDGGENEMSLNEYRRNWLEGKPCK